jgi:prepilin-type N-terminal cleavage/methylation domain-containing protein
MLVTQTPHLPGDEGFSILEVLVATSIVAVGVCALAQLVALAVHTNLHAKQTTIAAVLAQQKMEQLLSETATGLTASPADALGHNLEGYSDFLDAAGHLLGGGPATLAGTVYVRRWSVDPLPGSHNNTRILQVLVTDLRSRAIARFAVAKARKAS